MPIPGQLCDFVLSACCKWLLGWHGIVKSQSRGESFFLAFLVTHRTMVGEKKLSYYFANVQVKTGWLFLYCIR